VNDKWLIVNELYLKLTSVSKFTHEQIRGFYFFKILNFDRPFKRLSIVQNKLLSELFWITKKLLTKF
jgi:hypothetical protein